MSKSKTLGVRRKGESVSVISCSRRSGLTYADVCSVVRPYRMHADVARSVVCLYVCVFGTWVSCAKNG